MAGSLEELNKALGDTLRARGIEQQIKAKLRAEIFSVLEGESPSQPAQISSENLVINELIRDYLEFNKYQHSASVFVAETGQEAEASLPRGVLAQEFNVAAPIELTTAESGARRPVPLLYAILREARQRARDKSEEESLHSTSAA